MRFLIEHETRLDFSAPVYEHHCELRMSPRQGPHHQVLSTRIEVDPSVELRPYVDVFGNTVHAFDLLKPHSNLVTRIFSEVETTLKNPFDFQLMSPKSEATWYRQRLKEDPFLWQYILHRSPVVPEWSSLDLTGFPTPPEIDREQSIHFSLFKALDWAASALKYQPGTSHIHSTLQEVVSRRKGVCQDFTHLLLALIRSWGLPSRYAMGYMKATVEGYDASNDDDTSHAWVEVLIPGAGWRGYDATNRLCANDLYIPLAVGRDYLDAAPQRGTFKGLGTQQKQTLRVVLDHRPPDPTVVSQSQQQAAQE